MTHQTAAADPDRLQPPGAHLLALEWRAPLELMASLALWPLLRRGARGDGHPVIVFPGLASPDSTTGLLRRFLSERGYAPHRWEQGFNLGPRPGVLDACLQHVVDVQRVARRKVSLIGWSLGGVYARELAKLAPDSVRCVITLGAPFSGHPKASNAWRLYELISGQRAGDQVNEQLRQPPPVPTTSIYSRSDGVVNWQCSIQTEGPMAENIEVHASHAGLGVNASALYAIGDRLAQAEGAWRPFERSGVRQWIYGRAPRR